MNLLFIRSNFGKTASDENDRKIDTWYKLLEVHPI